MTFNGKIPQQCSIILYSVLKDAAVHYDRLDQGNLILSETIIKFK